MTDKRKRSNKKSRNRRGRNRRRNNRGGSKNRRRRGRNRNRNRGRGSRNKPRGSIQDLRDTGLEELTAIDPQPRLQLEREGGPVSCLLIDMFCPIGRGQRGLIISPPKAGKTMLLKQIGEALLANHDDVELYILLVDERPEEVTDFTRSLKHDRCTVRASSNDHPVSRHIETAINTITEAKQKAAKGKHIVILMDSLTRLGRAFNQDRRHANSGRTLSGGVDAKALNLPKQLFGSARNTDESGSLAIIATCLIDTGSQADQLIFEEFKGTGNMELQLDRKLADQRIFPAINLAASGTRKEHKLIPMSDLERINAMRRLLLKLKPAEQMERLLSLMKRFETNDELMEYQP